MQTRAMFLEWFAIAEATMAGRYSLENGNTGSQPYLFTSPSMAAIAVLGRSANGCLEWKTEQGQTLDGAKRQTWSAST